MKVTASFLRSNIYQILDRVKDTGMPVEIHRKGSILKIVASKHKSRLSNIKKKKNVYSGKIDDLIYINWEKYWKP